MSFILFLIAYLLVGYFLFEKPYRHKIKSMTSEEKENLRTNRNGCAGILVMIIFGNIIHWLITIRIHSIIILLTCVVLGAIWMFILWPAWKQFWDKKDNK